MNKVVLCEPYRTAIGSFAGTLSDIDLIELNEAFSVQVLAVLQELPTSEEKLNVNEEVIALGHSIGATEPILLVKILKEMKRRDLSLGLISLCVGGGMGIAMVVER